MVVAGFEVIKHMFNFTVSVNQEADAVNAVVGFTHKRLFAPDAELLAPLFDEIREGVEPAELLVRLGDLYPKMNTAKLQELMARAIMLATIIGEASAREEADANA